MEGCFADDYTEAREKFLGAATAVNASLSHFPLAGLGPPGVALSTDVAWLGPPDAPKVLVTISATHGVEGFFGSAVQTEWLRRVAAEPLPESMAALHVHALNPYGFAWLRRVNEQNVDINRNWMDFSDPGTLPASPLYDELSPDLCPSDWSPHSQAETGQKLYAWIQKRGMKLYQKAVSSGQWTHPKGLFYGGRAPTWSRLLLTRILTSRLAHARRVCILDFHTGLGPVGYAEPIIGLPSDHPGFARTRGWLGGAARSLYGESVSAEIHGDGLSAMAGLLPHAVVDTAALECGIRPIADVAHALRADAWLHAYGDPCGPEAAPIKASIRAAFHSDDPFWQGMALGQGLAACRAAVGGLASGTG